MFIVKHVWDTPTRPCRFSLNLQDACVFADFDVNWHGEVYLTRISFDGYGCCTTERDASRLSAEESQVLLNFVDADDVDRDEVREILYRYFAANQDVIWRDALVENGLWSRRMEPSPTDVIKAIRDKLSAEAGYDIHRIVEEARRRQRESGRVYITLPPRPPFSEDGLDPPLIVEATTPQV